MSSTVAESPERRARGTSARHPAASAAWAALTATRGPPRRRAGSPAVFALADEAVAAVGGDHHHRGAVGDELHPLRDVVGAHVAEHHAVARAHRGERHRVAHHVDVHAERAVDDRRLREAAEGLRGHDVVVVPERREEHVDARVDDERALAVGHALVGEHRGDHRARRRRRARGRSRARSWARGRADSRARRAPRPPRRRSGRRAATPARRGGTAP